MGFVQDNCVIQTSASPGLRLPRIADSLIRVLESEKESPVRRSSRLSEGCLLFLRAEEKSCEYIGLSQSKARLWLTDRCAYRLIEKMKSRSTFVYRNFKERVLRDHSRVKSSWWELTSLSPLVCSGAKNGTPSIYKRSSQPGHSGPNLHLASVLQVNRFNNSDCIISFRWSQEKTGFFLP